MAIWVCYKAMRWVFCDFSSDLTTPEHYGAAISALRASLMSTLPGSASSSGFTTTGPCVVSGNCISSPNYPSNYNSNEACSISPTRSGQLSVSGFSTEQGYDKLTVAGTQYQGTSGPTGVYVSSSMSITWSSDNSQESTGWNICLPSTQGSGLEVQ